MQGTEYKTKESILRRAQEAIGVPLGSIDKTKRLLTGKGAIGSVIEESWFGYHINSESEPDFPEAGVELKVTPYVKSKDGDIRAKERLVCNIINYMEEYNRTFYTSSFWHKCETMLLMSYEHKYDVPKCDYTIDAAVLFGFPEEDLLIIENDWQIIMTKVRNGRAHEISEGDTLYLAACTKGVTAETSIRRQPFSTIPAKQRAYSLKASYMTHVLCTYIFGNVQSEKVIKDWHILQNNSFEEYIVNTVSPYFGMSVQALKDKFDITGNPKNLNEILLGKMLGVRGKIAYTEEFQKASIVPKTIRVNMNNRIRESMSFPAFDFIELSKETWEESTLYNYLAPTKFLFVIFKEKSADVYNFDRIQFWNIPADDLEEVHRVWERTVETINNGVILTPGKNGTSNNLPKKTESYVSHVRPKGRDRDDKLPLPDGRMMTKQCFWLNNDYIERQIRIIK